MKKVITHAPCHGTLVVDTAVRFALTFVALLQHLVPADCAVVNRDVPPNSIVAGVPARVIRQIDEDDRINVWDTYMKNETPLSVRKRKATK